VLRRLVVCAAFSTWCFFNTWAKLAQGGFLYFARFDPLTAVVVPIPCWEMFLTIAMLAAWESCRRLPAQRAQTIHKLFLAACAAPIGIGAAGAVELSPANLEPIVRSRIFWPVAGVLIVAIAVFAFQRARTASHFMREILFYSTPLLTVTIFQAARESLIPFSHADYADRPLAAPLASAQSRTRVIWIIFDELSEAITFSNRPAGLELPNFDRLRAQSFYATAAEPPAGFTLNSIPSLLLGRRVDAATRGPADLEIQSPGRQAAPWSFLPNIFDAARGLGFNTALVGWYHPYGRLLDHSLTRCYWTAMWLPRDVEEPSAPESLARAIWDRARLQSDALPVIHHIPGWSPQKHQREQAVEHFKYLRDRAIAIAAEPSIGLAFIHLPVPHPPAIYDRDRQELTAGRSRGYLDNVALADLTLGALRRRMEETGLWDQSALLVSSDHSWRTAIWRDQHEWNQEDEAVASLNSVRVPFLLKLPGQVFGGLYTERFNTVVSSRIVRAILAGELKDPGGIASLIGSGRENDP
jgi:hypothetical protein